MLTATERNYLGVASPKRCRFCGRGVPAVRFKTDAHVFPTFLGNRHLLSHYECDSCNTFFGQGAEDHFGKYVGLQGVAGGVRGRDASRTFVSNDQQIRWEFRDGRGWIDAPLGTDHVKIDTVGGSITISAPAQAYVPRLAYKCLLKMAFSVMPDADVAAYPEALAWLCKSTPETNAEKAQNLFAILTTVGGKLASLRFITYALLRRKNPADIVPEYSFAIGWGNFGYQMFIPFCPRDAHLAGRSLKLERFPMPNMRPLAGRNFNYAVVDFSSSDRKKSDVQTVHLKGEFGAHPPEGV
jgi:hypothetical protein